MLLLQNIAKSFSGHPVLCNISLNLAPGEIVCLGGPSGVGKSTLLEIAAGLLLPDAGTVRRVCPPALAFQDDALLPWASCLENILYILSAQESLTNRVAKARHWLNAFGLAADKFPPELSGGMRRRLNLARAFASERRLLLLDEPFAFLDEALQKIVAQHCLERANQGYALFLTSHSFTTLQNAAVAMQFPLDRVKAYALEGGFLRPVL